MMQSVSSFKRRKWILLVLVCMIPLLYVLAYLWNETTLFGNDSLYKPLSDCPFPPQVVDGDSHWSEVVPDSSWDKLAQEDIFQSLGAIAIDSKDRIYVGGNFNQIGSLQTGGIALWDPAGGGQWKTLGSGLLANVEGMTISRLEIDAQDRVYVGGSFNMAGDQIVNGIAMWDGQAWHPLGSGLMDGNLSDFALLGEGKLFAAGSFSQIGGQKADGIAFWDGQAWQDPGHMSQKLESLIGAKPENVAAIAYDPTHKVLYASGTFTRDDSAKGFLAVWQEENQAWTAIDESSGVMWLNRLKIAPWGPLIAAGSTRFSVGPYGALTIGGSSESPPASYGIATYENSKWKGLKTGLTLMGGSKSYLSGHGDTQVDPVFITEIAFDRKGQVYIVGRFVAVDNRCMYGIARWDGREWFALGSGLTPTNYLGPARSLAFDSKGNLYVAGNFQTAGGKSIRYLARWTP